MTAGRKHLLSAAAVVLLCAALLCSFILVAYCAHHDCTHGDDCEVCRIIACCIRTLSEICPAAVFAAVTAGVSAAAASGIKNTLRKRGAVTPVTLRTELRD